MFLRFLFCLGLLGVAAAQDIQRPASFPQVTIQGTARPDAGYFVERVIVNGRAYSPEQMDQAGQAALLATGWKSATVKKRQKLALDWCAQVALAGKVVLDKVPDDFADKSSFHPPRAALEKDGKVHVRLYWYRHGGNVRVAVHQYSLGHWSVAPDGQMKRL